MTEMVQQRSWGARAELERFPVNVRLEISALWTAMLFVFAYVDFYGLLRPDVRADIAAGEIGGFNINQSFLLATMLYIAIPILMVPASLLLPARAGRLINMALSGIYALTVIAGAVGEWGYYVFGSGVEVALLATIFYLALTWPKAVPSPS
jgi:hypothetical protein